MCCSALKWILGDLSKIAPTAHILLVCGHWVRIALMIALQKKQGLWAKVELWSPTCANGHPCWILGDCWAWFSGESIGTLFFWQRCSHSCTTDWRSFLTDWARNVWCFRKASIMSPYYVKYLPKYWRVQPHLDDTLLTLIIQMMKIIINTIVWH